MVGRTDDPSPEVADRGQAFWRGATPLERQFREPCDTIVVVSAGVH